jgi:multidrug efflux pump
VVEGVGYDGVFGAEQGFEQAAVGIEAGGEQDGANTTLNSGRMLVNLKPHGERKDDAHQIIERLRVQLGDQQTGVAGIRAYLQPVQELSIEDRVSRTQYQMTLTSPDMEELSLWTSRLLDRLQSEPSLSDVASDLQNQGLQAYVEIHRDQAARLGVTVATEDSGTGPPARVGT